MCMATPVQVKSKIKNKKSRFMVTGGKEVDTSLLSGLKVGDWLLCHADLAINKISKKEAANIFGLINKCSHTHH